MEPRSPFEHLQFSGELACEFFGVFSRFEFALKENGYWRSGRSAAAEPNWDKFAGEIANSFQQGQSAEVAAALTYLVNEPPMRQIIENNSVSWRPTIFPNASQAHKAFLAIRTVRNNLFHGGKHTPHSPPGRDEELVKASLVVLKHCLSLHKGLRSDYETSAF